MGGEGLIGGGDNPFCASLNLWGKVGEWPASKDSHGESCSTGIPSTSGASSLDFAWCLTNTATVSPEGLIPERIKQYPLGSTTVAG